MIRRRWPSVLIVPYLLIVASGLFLLSPVLGAGRPRSKAQNVPPAPHCPGSYSDDLNALSAQARELDGLPKARYSYCIRSVATYECLSYASDGKVRHKKKSVVAHGTGFGFRQSANDTLILTNQHLADWPAVTDAEHVVEGVPAGCKRSVETLRIVENESDDYGRDDIPLTRVVGDPALDIAILRAHVVLPILPWKIGRSGALKERNVIQVQGFPLGVFKAINVGKVISLHDQDIENEWDHDDFVVDALLSAGNSGSPVLAVSCETGEFELVGVYHAGYSHGSALNVVVGIDQVRDLMTTLKRSPHPASDPPPALAAGDRKRLIEVSRSLVEPFFQFGLLPAAVRSRPDGALVFEVFSRAFPREPRPLLVIEDPAGPEGVFGDFTRVWFGNEKGLKPYAKSDLDADTLRQVSACLEALRLDASTAFSLHAALPEPTGTREQFKRTTRLQRVVSRSIQSHNGLAQSIEDLSERFSPEPAESAVPFSEVFASALDVLPDPDSLEEPEQPVVQGH